MQKQKSQTKWWQYKCKTELAFAFLTYNHKILQRNTKIALYFCVFFFPSFITTCNFYYKSSHLNATMMNKRVRYVSLIIFVSSGGIFFFFTTWLLLFRRQFGIVLRFMKCKCGSIGEKTGERERKIETEREKTQYFFLLLLLTLIPNHRTDLSKHRINWRHKLTLKRQLEWR